VPTSNPAPKTVTSFNFSCKHSRKSSNTLNISYNMPRYWHHTLKYTVADMHAIECRYQLPACHITKHYGSDTKLTLLLLLQLQ
jgi:hypothetical protein